MNTEEALDENDLDRQLADLDENSNAAVDTTVRELYAELQALTDQLKLPVDPNPYEQEPACRQVVERAKALSLEVSVGDADTPSSCVKPIPTTLDHFRIVRLLGQGGMGAVYLAEDTRLGREVALKIMRAESAAKPSAKERFLREARLAAALEHDHIVPIYHVGEADGTPYLAMPFLKGQSLDDVLQARKTLANEEVIRLGIQVAQGLAAAHERGLIHRDIKPANLWVEPTGRIKILDFGLARSSHGDIGLTQSGTILGTPSYMAPEQARGLKLDGRADLYSLGVVLYRAATGELPLQGEDTMSMLMALVTETPRSACEINPAVAPELSALIMRLLAKDPDRRPAAAQAVIQELHALLPPAATIATVVPMVAPAKQNPWADIDVAADETEVVTALARPTAEIIRRPPRRRLLVAAGFLAFAVLLAAGVILIVRDKDGKKIAEIEVPVGGKVEIVGNNHSAKSPPKNEPEITIVGGDPDRRAAEYVLSIGGQVQINDMGQWINADLMPKELFRLTAVNLIDNPKVTEAGLAHFKDCKGLTQLNMSRTKVTDAGLAHFKDCTNLANLDLSYTHLTDAGLAHFKDFPKLSLLSLDGTQVTDAGLAHFQGCKNLRHLVLNFTPVTDAGLACFKDMKELVHLGLSDTQVTDAGSAHFKDCKGLWSLNLNNTRVTDVGLAHFKDCTDLLSLSLNNTGVTDAGLTHFKDCTKLTYLDLGGTRLSDTGLADFKGCKELIYLDLSRTQVTNAGFANFKDCDKLRSLLLYKTQVTDKGLGFLKNFKDLTYLYLRQTQVTPQFIDELRAALPKCKIDWDGAKE